MMLFYPNSDSCPSHIAECISEMRYRKHTAQTMKRIRTTYDSLQLFMDCVILTYEANDWTLDSKERAFFRKEFKSS